MHGIRIRWKYSFYYTLLVFSLSNSAFAENMSDLEMDTRASPHHALAKGERRVHLHEVSLGSGYAWGSLRRDQGDIEVYPVFLRFGFDVNPLLGFREQGGTWQFALEPFVNQIVEPETGIEVGLDFFLRYTYPFFDRLAIYAEAGAGPMYFSIDTLEQSEAGFNFLDQVGLGVQYFIRDNKALGLGYRWRHISNLGLNSGPNTGINTHSLIVFLSVFY